MGVRDRIILNTALAESIPITPPDRLDLAAIKLGYSGYRGKQKEAVRAFVEEGRNLLLIAPTGLGKSAVYQVLPHLIDGLIVVVSPLIALQVDQVAGLKKRGIKADYINSTLTEEEKREVERKVKSGETQMLYVAPERLNDFDFIELTAARNVGALVADECFPAGTMISTPRGRIPIEKIRAGDEVFSCPFQANGRFTNDPNPNVKKVLKTFEKDFPYGRFVTIEWFNGNRRGSFTCTSNHKVYEVKGGRKKSKFKEAIDFLPGNHVAILCPVGESTIATVVSVKVFLVYEKTVYDFEVEDDHNYFANDVLVSNCHLICQWGMGFRPDYSFIDSFRIMVGNPPVMGLSATATPKMCDYIIKNLRMRGTKQHPEQVAHITSGFDRPNLYFNMRESCKGVRVRMLV